MARSWGPVGLVGLLALTAGCLEAGRSPLVDPNDVLDDGHGHAAPMADLRLELRECQEGGGVSLYNMQEGSTGPVAPFRRTNIQDDVGHPVVASYGAPIPPGGATTGIWHISFACEEHIVNGESLGPLSGGWVAVRILPPDWDTSGIKRQYFVADLAFDNWPLVDAFNREGVHASRVLDSKIEWLAPDLVHTVFNDEEHGVFETHAKMKDYRVMETGPMRFWMFISTDADHVHDVSGRGTFRPISFDLVNSGSGPRHLVVDGTGFLSHTRTDEHNVGPVPQPGAAGNVGGMLWTGFDRTLTAGPAPEGLTFNRTWIH